MRELTKRMTAAEFLGKAKTQAKRSVLEQELESQIQYAGLDKPETEYRFLKDRRFRFDFAWPKYKLAVEVQGGYYSNGRHNRNPIPDLKKANLAGIHGWTVIFAKPDEVKSGATLALIVEALSND